MEIGCFKRKFKKSLLSFCKNNKKLFELGLHEETLNHQIAVELNYNFKNYNVDCEYTHHGSELKNNLEGKIVRPDVVIHERGCDSKNLAIIEIKRHCNSLKDDQKIIKYSNLNYSYGVVLKFDGKGNVNQDKTSIYLYSEQRWDTF